MLVYKIKKVEKKAPMKVTLEMRMIGLSDVTLSPFKVNECDSKSNIGGFCSIEVLTFANHDLLPTVQKEDLEEWE